MAGGMNTQTVTQKMKGSKSIGGEEMMERLENWEEVTKRLFRMAEVRTIRFAHLKERLMSIKGRHNNGC